MSATQITPPPGEEPTIARPTLTRSPRFDRMARDLAGYGGIDVADGVTDRLAGSHDASHYVLVPDGIVRPRTAADVANVMSAASTAGLPVTFRSGGTSLSGQAGGAGVQVDTRRAFRGIEVLDDGARVRVQPGATIQAVNNVLARHGRKLGPDPASSSACTVGGVVADNSSGMSCGTAFNTYNTLESMVFVLPSGTTIDTADPLADEHLREAEPQLHEGLLRLRRRVVANPESMRIIRHQYSMKNTMGYGINALVDYEEPARILEHLLIGSEGTLGFVASATFRTLPVSRAVSTGLLVFPDLLRAASAVPDLVAAGMATAELMDATSLGVAQRAGRVPGSIAAIDVSRQAALLVELQADTVQEVEEKTRGVQPILDSLDLETAASMTDDATERAKLWVTRNGLYAAVAGNRPTGTNALLEDVAVPVDALGETCRTLGELFEHHGYRDSVIFGHAKDGNIHFMLNEQFADPAKLRRYQEFTEDMVELVLGNRGTLKAEHGTGRIMAPYVRRQFGDELYDVMVEVKRMVDPGAVLNPGVVINEDPDCYVRNLKVAEEVEEEVDRCVECGYCEPVCPSKDVTLTPRQRIVIRRELAAAEARGDRDLADRLREDWNYAGEQTCAVDGMCVTRCPVDINTGDLVRRLRSERDAPRQDAAWTAAAQRWGVGHRAASAALSAATMLPWPVSRGATSAGRFILGDDAVPQYNEHLPAGGPPRRPRHDDTARFVFFPACVNAMFGGVDDRGRADVVTATVAFERLARRAGMHWATPDGVGSMCCGTPWKSKGMTNGFDLMSDRVLNGLWEATDGGRLPVVCDAASCTEGLQTMRDKVTAAAQAGPEASAGPDGAPRDFARIRFVDAVEFAAQTLLPRLEITRRVSSLALHPTCSLTHLGLQDDLETLGRAVAEESVVPLAWGCCAYAGDRGMLHPELTRSATRAEAAEVTNREFDAYASANRTCEQGMTEATGRTYQNILQLLEWATDGSAREDADPPVA